MYILLEVLAFCVYIPEFNKTAGNRALWQLQYYFDKALSNTKYCNKTLIIIAGDFNKADPTSFCRTNQVRRLNYTPTRKEKCLDIILTNAPNCYKVETWPQLATSDHAVVLAQATISGYTNSKPKPIKRLVRTGKIRDTVNKIRSTDWEPIINKLNIDPQAATDDFYSTILTAENYCQPLKICKFRDDQPWMTHEIKNQIKKRQKLFHSSKRDEWKQTCSDIKKEIRKAKKITFKKRTF